MSNTEASRLAKLDRLTEHDLKMFASYVAGAYPELYDRVIAYVLRDRVLCNDCRENERMFREGRPAKAYHVRGAYKDGPGDTPILMGVGAFDPDTAKRIARERLRSDGYEDPYVLSVEEIRDVPENNGWIFGTTVVYRIGDE